MLVSLNTLSIDDLESWREVLNILLFAATLAVCVGVYLEKEANPESVKREGWSLVVWGISLEIICATGIWQIDSSISSRQRSEIISLETYLTPRVLTDEQNAFIAEKLVSPFKIKYAFTAVNEEEANLAIALSQNVFSKVGWDWVDWPSAAGEIGTWLPYAKKRVGNVMLSGIQVRVFNSKLSDVAKVLVTSLKEVGLDSVRIDAADVLVDDPKVPMLIEIMIGQKPRYQLPRR